MDQIAAEIKPAPFFAKVLPSVVNPSEEERDTGLLVIREDEEPHYKVKRGIVIDIGSEVLEYFEVKRGDALYYLHSHQVGEVELVLCSENNVIGWEQGYK